MKINKKKINNFPAKSIFFWILIFSAVFLALNYNRAQSVPEKEIRYDTFITEIEKSNIKLVRFKNNRIRGELIKKGFFIDKKTGEETAYSQFKTANPFNDDIHLQELLSKYNVQIIPEAENSFWTTWVGPVLPFLLIFGLFWFFLYRQIQGGGNRALAFGKSRAKLFGGDRPKVTFQDVADAEEPKQELQEIISFLKEPGKFTKLGAKIPKGVLLFGPPGCGKTLLAKAVAGEAAVPFYSISGSDFVELFVGVGASRVRDLFEQGRKSAAASGHGCIIFIDEIDAVGRQRFAGIGGGHDEREQTLNQLLSEMDGFDTKTGVILIAATNRPDVLDAALLRPGRFDRQVEVYSPDIVGREKILNVHARGVKLTKNLNMKTIARGTPGFSGADLANLVNEAALLAARKNKDKVGMKEFEEAKERVIAGPERKSGIISDYEKGIVAYHEAGHALLAYLIPEADPLHKVSIIPRGGQALGYTLQIPMEDRYLTTKTELLGRMTVYLGGRVSEKIVFKEETTGAQNDLERVSQVARKMVCEFGMSEVLGPLTYREKPEQVFLGRDITKEKSYSEKVAVDIDSEVQSIVKEKEVLDAKEVDKILENGQGKDKKSSQNDSGSNRGKSGQAGIESNS
jgi:cell division protease FtsH